MNVSKKVRTGLLLFFSATAILTIITTSVSKEKMDENSVLKNTAITFKNAVVNVDTADTEILREKGLSGRASLPDGMGMWFIYPKSGIYSFWMPDMHFPIDIIWFDGNLRVVYVQENAAPESYPHVFTPDAPAQYVLEVSAGFIRKYGVSVGDTVSVSDIHLQPLIFLDI
jgi:hypothetical protein